MRKYEKMTDSVKELPRTGLPPPGMTLEEFAAMFREVDKGKALLKLSDEEVLALDLNGLDDWELVLAAERFEVMGRDGLRLEALERACRSPEHNVMIWYGELYADVVNELRIRGDYEEAIYYQKLAMEEDLNYCDGMNLVGNQRDLAELYLGKGNFEEGLRLFEKLVELDRSDIWLYNSLAMTLPAVGLGELGALAAKRGIEIATATKDREYILSQLGELLTEAERTEDRSENLLPSSVYSRWRELLTRPLPLIPYILSRESQAGVLAEGHRTKVGRNEPCPCGSGKKYKQCCSG